MRDVQTLSKEDTTVLVRTADAEVLALVDAAFRRMQAHQRRLAVELRRSRVAALDGVTAGVFSALAALHRTALGVLGKLRELETDDVSKDRAITTFSLIAAGVAAHDRSLRARSEKERTRLGARSRSLLTASESAFRALDESLDCPYGCGRS